MTTRVGVERFTNPLPRAADCAARRLSAVAFTIAHLHPYTRPDSPFYSVCRLLIYLGTQLDKVIKLIIIEH